MKCIYVRPCSTYKGLSLEWKLSRNCGLCQQYPSDSGDKVVALEIGTCKL